MCYTYQISPLEQLPKVDQISGEPLGSRYLAVAATNTEAGPTHHKGTEHRLYPLQE